MALQRSSEHWREYEFHAHLTAIARKPFAWGKHDCCLFAANAIRSFAALDTTEAAAANAANTAAHVAADNISHHTHPAERRAAHAAVVEGFTGVDIAADFRGQYHDKLSAFKAIKRITGGSTVADAAAWCAAKYGLEELQHPLCAQRGDLVVMHQDAVAGEDQLIVGIVHLTGAHLVSVAESGAVRLPITNIVRAWRV
jgi:hypothetical protein